jgi:glutaredoxin
VEQITLSIVGKPGCHLCDDAKEVIDSVVRQFPEVELESVSIEDNPLWADIYGERIPVVLLNGVEHAQWRVDPEKLIRALRQAQADLDAQEPTTGSLFTF